MRASSKRLGDVSPLGETVDEFYLCQLREPAYRRAQAKFAVAEQCARALIEHRMKTTQTQRDLANQLGMTESMVSRLERGNHVPNVQTLCRIADALGKNLSSRLSSPRQPQFDLQNCS